ncbi:MAG TPA: tetratricopeptide repeat protein [Pseudolabrys sp.]|nr:tetratricopeptide repeat protein [Pseudolabrys sp.]
MTTDGNWAPRLAQEKRLFQLEEMLATGRATVELEIERAVLLNALDRFLDAQKTFVEILLRTPSNFSALNEFGTCLASQGFIAAACRVYSEAITHHPDNPMGHINLANLLLRGGKLPEAREHYEIALRLDPEHPQAHQGLGAVFSGAGDHSAAQPHFKKGFRNHGVSTLPYRGTRPPVPLLLLVSSGGGNIPTASFLDDRIFLTSVIVADHVDPSAPLPPHQLVFNAIGDADLCRPALDAAARLIKRTDAPIINDPRAVFKTGRTDNAKRLSALPGVVTPRTIAMPRDALTGPQASAVIAGHGFAYPFLLRSPGFHTGHHFVLVKTAADLSAAAASLPGDELLAIEYLDARGRDGNARKYRVMIIGGRIYPLHLAISRQWKVHYFTADMADDSDHRSEDAAFLGDMAAVLGGKAVTALERIGGELGLDYGGVDFGIGPDGDVLLFEANATMVVNRPESDERWSYRRAAVTNILDAVRAMILSRITDTQRRNAG